MRTQQLQQSWQQAVEGLVGWMTTGGEVGRDLESPPAMPHRQASSRRITRAPCPTGSVRPLNHPPPVPATRGAAQTRHPAKPPVGPGSAAAPWRRPFVPAPEPPHAAASWTAGQSRRSLPHHRPARRRRRRRRCRRRLAAPRRQQRGRWGAEGRGAPSGAVPAHRPAASRLRRGGTGGGRGRLVGVCSEQKQARNSGNSQPQCHPLLQSPLPLPHPLAACRAWRRSAGCGWRHEPTRRPRCLRVMGV